MGTEPIRTEDSFEHRATTALLDVRSALLGVFKSIPDLSGQRPIDISNALALDMKLAWKASRLVRSTEPGEILNDLPGRPGFKKLLTAAEAAGASSGSIDALKAVYEELNRLITTLAGSRSVFETMVTGIDPRSDSPLAIEQRRQLFGSARSVTGIQCTSSYRLDLLAPSTVGTRLDCATIRISTDLVRFHANAPWRLRLPAVLDDAGRRSRPELCEPLAPEAASGPPLIPELCRGPASSLKSINRADSTREFGLEDDLIGPDSRRTIACGEILRSAEPNRPTSGHHGLHQVMRLRTPMETAVMDVLMHRDVFAISGEPRAIIYSDLFGERSAAHYRETDRMPIRVALNGFDTVSDVPAPAGVDEDTFRRLTELAFDRTGWDRDAFRYHRIEVPFPPVPSSLVYEVAFEDGRSESF